MGTSRDDLVARIQALSMQKHMGMDVRDEAKQVVEACRSEDDKKVVMQLCNALGVPYK